ncbi:MAG: hypothetical protein ACR2QE_02555 [Acidimicrobiales bacterium]
MIRRLILVVVFIALAAACGGADADDATGALGEAPGVENPDTTDEPASVFPLPPGELSELFPYSVIDNESVRSETATFLLAGPGVDAVITYYDDLLSAMGYVIDDPVALGDSLAIDISDPANPNVTAVIQAGPVATDDATVQLNQERTEIKE